ncbi:MAG: glucosidase [Bacteroidia bacterium]|nr:glucosidase [Bacteroidia bacterium]
MNYLSEHIRREEQKSGKKDWQLWGPYLSERQWGTVREDYSANGDAWNYFPHDHARSRAYRWGEDGLGGISDKHQYLCFALALWNGKDPILKERLFGLTGPEGNHGEDVKELYFYLDSTPSHSFMHFLYKYPQATYPYQQLVAVNRMRGKTEGEYEIEETGVFDESRYFDVSVVYAKADANDILIEITVSNRGPEPAPFTLLPTLWFRNRWSYKPERAKPLLRTAQGGSDWGHVHASAKTLGDYHLFFETADRLLFTENETNQEKIFGKPNPHPFVKDAFHRAIVEGDTNFLLEKTSGTKCAPVYSGTLAAGESRSVRLRLAAFIPEENPLKETFTNVMRLRKTEADEFYAQFTPPGQNPELARIQRQAFAGMLWTKQFYHIDIPLWLNGDPGQVPPPESRKKGRNHSWKTLNNEDILSMPDKWEYPWYAAWDLAFHCVPLAMIDPEFAKNQLILILREWYMAPSGQIPAYEWNFSDVNPPVHAWAALRVYEIEKKMTGTGDTDFLKRVFQKLILNFTWWVNRKDSQGNNVFEGGFLGLDNIGIFDRSNDLPEGGHLEQADGTSWMGLYSLNLMQMALEIACTDPSYEDVATKFFEHFVYIAEALNTFGEGRISLWDEEDGFYYDVIQFPDGHYERIKVRSLVGLSALFAVTIIPKSLQEKVPEFMGRLNWFRNYRRENKEYGVMEEREDGTILLAMVAEQRLERLLEAMLDEDEFLAPGGIRSISKFHERHLYQLSLKGRQYSIRYEPGESTTNLFGGNSNWRGPVWFPMNYLLIEALRTYEAFYGEPYKVEFPTGSGEKYTFTQVADAISRRLVSIFLPDEKGERPVNGGVALFRDDPYFRDLVLFYEYFHGDNSRGIGASHQTGWTGLVAELISRI